MSDSINKSEKIASVIYLITSFFDTSEPLKWRLRDLASELVSVTVNIKDSLLKDKINPLDIREVALKLMTLLYVAKDAGLISLTNHEIIQEEINKYLIKPEEQHDISGSFNSYNQPLVKLDGPSNIMGIKDKTMLKETSIKEFGTVSVRKNSRQSVIITLLKRKKEVMIKDITMLISGCSDKTIQRELSSMVSSGLIKKIGDKRWSRY